MSEQQEWFVRKLERLDLYALAREGQKWEIPTAIPLDLAQFICTQLNAEIARLTAQAARGALAEKYAKHLNNAVLMGSHLDGFERDWIADWRALTSTPDTSKEGNDGNG